MISREDVWTDVWIGCSCYWCLQVFFKRDKLRYDKISMSGGGSAKVHVQNRLYVPDPFVVRETRRSLFKVGMIFFALSLDGMKSRFWMKITFHWSESQVEILFPIFCLSFWREWHHKPLVLTSNMPFLLKPVTSCVLLHVSQTPTSVNPTPWGRRDHGHVEGLGLVVGSDHALLWSEWRKVEGRPIFGMTDSWAKKKDLWLVVLNCLCSMHIAMIQPKFWDGIEV